jgi:hypothetical protein
METQWMVGMMLLLLPRLLAGQLADEPGPAQCSAGDDRNASSTGKTSTTE